MKNNESRFYSILSKHVKSTEQSKQISSSTIEQTPESLETIKIISQKILFGIKFIIKTILICAVLYFTWNNSISKMFFLQPISYLESFYIFILSNILFKK